MLHKKGALKNFAKFTGKHLFLKVTDHSLQICEFCEIFKNNFLTENFRATASVDSVPHLYPPGHTWHSLLPPILYVPSTHNTGVCDVFLHEWLGGQTLQLMLWVSLAYVPTAQGIGEIVDSIGQ